MESKICEIYIDQNKAENGAISQKEEMAQEAGLVSYANALWLQGTNIKPLLQEDLEAWIRWLPTSYRTDVKEKREFWYGKWEDGLVAVAQLPWENYNFHEGVPQGILQFIGMVRHHFDALEIRTPEKVNIPLPGHDPLLIGWIGGVAYKLARWAECAEHVIDFSVIKKAYLAGKKKVEIERGKPFWSRGYAGELWGCAGFTAFALLLFHSIFSEPQTGIIKTASCFAFAVTLSGTALWLAKRIVQAKRSHSFLIKKLERELRALEA